MERRPPPARPDGEQPTVLVVDRVRGRTVAMAVEHPTTAGALLARYVRGHGLPTRTVDGEPIRYALADAAGAALADDGATLHATLDRVVLDSDDGRSTWQSLSATVAAIEAELGTGLRAEARAALEERVASVRDELRAEAGRRLRGLGSRLDWRARWRLRRLTAELATTDAFPEHAEAMGTLVRSVGPLAGATARTVVPIVAVGTAAVGGGVVADQLIDVPSAAEVAEDVAAILDEDVGPAGTERATADVDVDLLAAAVADRLSLADRVTNDDLRALLEGLADSLEEADPATAPILGGITTDPPTRVTTAGGSLWSIADDFRTGLLATAGGAGEGSQGCDVPATFEEPLGTYVLRVWAANLDVVGADPDTIEVDTVLRMPCPR